MAPSPFCQYADLLDRINQIDPHRYRSTRNYLDGAVSHLSPLITHGVLNTQQIGQILIAKFGVQACFKFLSELAWREFFQRSWQHHGPNIFTDLKRPQSPTLSSHPPVAFLDANTGIEAIDQSIQSLIQHGTIHNHARMWVSALICNTCQTHWLEPARWFYYHLLDGDLASNALSWQWVAGTFSHKKYLANQSNINRFSRTQQAGTPVDFDYPSLASMPPPDLWSERRPWQPAPAKLPASNLKQPILPGQRIALRSIWNLDPAWLLNTADRQILLIEPAQIVEHPLSSKRVEFILHWAKQINKLEIFVGAFADLPAPPTAQVTYQEHPTCSHWSGNELARPWLFPNTTKAYQSFSAFWKHAQKEIPS